MNDPVNYVDLTGLQWEYSQSTGQLYYINRQTGARTYIATGYSGHGEGLNNPDMQNVRDVGPIPRGTWRIGRQYHNPRLGQVTMNLDPEAETATFGRDLFRFHGDNAAGNQSASTGCIVLPRAIRERIANSGDTELRVIR